ncbi:MAG: riboflavin synthase [Spirochaetia bacterium]|nr:riboflavin synthase [Spirochaetia bacterium]
MFSGIVYDTGRVRRAVTRSGLKSFDIALTKPVVTPEKGMSIAVNGVCLTASSFKGVRQFTADVTQETLKKSTLAGLRPGSEVNIEYPLTMNTMLSGHIMQGHVDCTGKVSGIKKSADNNVLTVKYPEAFAKNLIEKGSVAVDGVSLTAFDVTDTAFSVSLIPETRKATIVHGYKTGTAVNLEFDVIGKYVEKILGQKARYR